MNHLSTDWDQVLTTFKKIWGYNDFRPPQGEIVRTLLEGKDALIVLPTGGGKSVCFQLPALLQTGLTLVISPLVALMENQVQELQQRHLRAALLHSELPSYQRQQTLQAIKSQQLRLLYLSPETLLSSSVWQLISQAEIKINGLILDEAHCLVQWGDSFRPAYRRLGAVRPALLKSKPTDSKIAIAAFTATADPKARDTIQKTLQLEQPEYFLLSPYRPNIHLQVRIIWTPKGRRQQMLDFIHAKHKQTGLVYVRSRRDSEELAQWFTSLNYQTAAYHAGLSPEKRRKIETSWLSGEIQFVVCTSAFGMGINKPDVRWVVHFQPPQLLSEYIQEVGRSGRDGKVANALTLISEPTGWLDPEDKQRNEFFARKLHKQYQQAQQIAKQIPSRGKIETITKQFSQGDIALALLHSTQRLEWEDPFSYRLHLDKPPQLSRNQQKSELSMTQYLNTRKCRWQFLLEAFGFSKEASGLKCRHCDNCQRGVSRGNPR
jgi:ATP-dependent DNA helicase RecQ